MSTETPEEWRWIPGFERRYQVSNLGRVRSFWWGKPRVMKTGVHKGNRTRYVQLGQKFSGTLAPLVLLAFVGPRPNGHIALHKNLDIADCRLENLYWGDNVDFRHDRRKRSPTKKRPAPRTDLRPHLDVIRARIANNEPDSRIARDYGVKPHTINRIKNGKRHAHG